jgi:hypothetical protein
MCVYACVGRVPVHALHMSHSSVAADARHNTPPTHTHTHCRDAVCARAARSSLQLSPPPHTHTRRTCWLAVCARAAARSSSRSVSLSAASISSRRASSFSRSATSDSSAATWCPVVVRRGVGCCGAVVACARTQHTHMHGAHERTALAPAPATTRTCARAAANSASFSACLAARPMRDAMSEVTLAWCGASGPPLPKPLPLPLCRCRREGREAPCCWGASGAASAWWLPPSTGVL